MFILIIMKPHIQVKTTILPALLLLAFLVGMGLIQFSTPDLPDNDGFYHIKFAQLMSSEGFLPEFRWLPLTILNQDDFYNHHFLFHVALIPFTLGDLRLGAKLAAVVFSSMAFLAIWYLLQRERVPLAWLWALALLGISEAFLFRMSITRTQSLSLGILALGMLVILQGNRWGISILSFLYVWTYNAFPLLPVMAFLYLMAGLIINKKGDWQLFALSCAGVVAGGIINPYFPENILFTLHHILPKLAQSTVSGLGNEWSPYNTTQLLENSLPALIAFASGTIAIGLAGRKMHMRTLFAFFIALLFALMFFRARRFVEYFPPFALIFASFAWAPLLEDYLSKMNPVGLAHNYRIRNLWPVTLAGLLVFSSIFVSIIGARRLIRNSKPHDLYQAASAWLVQNTPAGSLIFQTDWDDFPRLFFYNTHNTYLAGLDPTYTQLYNPSLYTLWVDITRGKLAEPSARIINSFGAKYVHSDLYHDDFLAVAAQDPAMIEVYRDDQAVIWKIIP